MQRICKFKTYKKDKTKTSEIKRKRIILLKHKWVKNNNQKTRAKEKYQR